jgi:hypothetical protein
MVVRVSAGVGLLPKTSIARNMILMVRELNRRFPDGKQHVTCYTCHRGSPTPAMAPQGS